MEELPAVAGAAEPEPAARIAELRAMMTALEDLQGPYPVPLRYMGNVNDPAFRAEHGLLYGFISAEIDEDHARDIAEDDQHRIVLRSALQTAQWSTNRIFGFGIPDHMDDGYSDDGSDIDPDESPTERFNRRQIQRAINISLRPEFDPEYSDPADRARVDAVPIKTLDRAAETDCVICMEPMEAGDEFMDIPCEHVMHAACSMRWFETARKCPTCNLELFPPA